MEHYGMIAGEEKMILALARGTSEREVAEQTGIEERAVRGRWKDADFRWAVLEAQERMFDATRGRLAGLAGPAVETLARLMLSNKPSEALGAAKAILEMGPRLRKAAEIEERINRLEDDDIDAEDADGNQTPADEEDSIRALAAGASEREAAEQVGLDEQTGEQTVSHRFGDDPFRRAVSRARGRLFHAPLGRLACLGSEAIGVLERSMESEQSSVARRAAKAVLQLGPKLREVEFDERITQLEQEAARRPKGASAL